MTIKPKYKHNCDHCVFVCRGLEAKARRFVEVDYYICLNPSLVGFTLLTRRSNGSSDYSSIANYSARDADRWSIEALREAELMGLVTAKNLYWFMFGHGEKKLNVVA